jgi:hypothetical protein
MQSALSVVTDVNVVDRQYVIVGDGSQELVKTKCGTPVVLKPNQKEEMIVSEFDRYPTINSSIGSLTSTKIDGGNIYSLNSTNLEIETDSESLDEFFAAGTFPAQIGREIHWTDEITTDDI